jgi:hypothetical protein
MRDETRVFPLSLIPHPSTLLVIQMSVVANIFLYPATPPYTVCPYVDTTGWLLQIPVMIISARGGGAATPTGVTTEPTFVLNGTTLSGASLPTLLPFNEGGSSNLSAFTYQMVAQIQPGAVLTMAAAPGWASVSGGTVGGTSSAGTGSAPLTVQNNSGLNLELALSADHEARL